MSLDRDASDRSVDRQLAHLGLLTARFLISALIFSIKVLVSV
jgi:hypothetical protein